MKVLFVVTAFYPEQAIGSIRISKFAKYFKKNNVSIHVISLTPPPWASHDESLYFKDLENIQWSVIDQSWLFKKIFRNMRVAAIGTAPGNVGGTSKFRFKNKIKSIAQFIYTLLKAFDWLLIVRKHAKRNLLKENFDFIFCSYPSFASPLTAINLKKLGIGKKVISDFRDPIINKKISNFNLRNILQNYILKNSDLKSFVSNGVRKQVVGMNYNSSELIIPNGYDPNDSNDLKTISLGKHDQTKGLFRFVYTGAIYSGKRDLKPFFRAISDILISSDHALDQMIFEYAGKEGDVFLSQASEFNLEGRVIDHGQVSRSESLKLQKKSDICLLATWNTQYDQGALTGKIFEYFMFKKPILAIVVGDKTGSEIYKIINQVGAGFCFEEASKNSYVQLKGWLEKSINDKKINGHVKSNYNDGVYEYDISQIVIGLKDKMNNSINSHKEL